MKSLVVDAISIAVGMLLGMALVAGTVYFFATPAKCDIFINQRTGESSSICFR